MITEFPRIIAGSDYLFLFSQQKGVIIGGKAIIRGRGLFQILLTRSRALILCSIFPVKKKYSNQNKLNIGVINF